MRFDGLFSGPGIRSLLTIAFTVLVIGGTAGLYYAYYVENQRSQYTAANYRATEEVAHLLASRIRAFGSLQSFMPKASPQEQVIGLHYEVIRLMDEIVDFRRESGTHALYRPERGAADQRRARISDLIATHARAIDPNALMPAALCRTDESLPRADELVRPSHTLPCTQEQVLERLAQIRPLALEAYRKAPAGSAEELELDRLTYFLFEHDSVLRKLTTAQRDQQLDGAQAADADNTQEAATRGASSLCTHKYFENLGLTSWLHGMRCQPSFDGAQSHGFEVSFEAGEYLMRHCFDPAFAAVCFSLPLAAMLDDAPLPASLDGFMVMHADGKVLYESPDVPRIEGISDLLSDSTPIAKPGEELEAGDTLAFAAGQQFILYSVPAMLPTSFGDGVEALSGSVYVVGMLSADRMNTLSTQPPVVFVSLTALLLVLGLLAIPWVRFALLEPAAATSGRELFVGVALGGFGAGLVVIAVLSGAWGWSSVDASQHQARGLAQTMAASIHDELDHRLAYSCATEIVGATRETEGEELNDWRQNGSALGLWLDPAGGALRCLHDTDSYCRVSPLGNAKVPPFRTLWRLDEAGVAEGLVVGGFEEPMQRPSLKDRGYFRAAVDRTRSQLCLGSGNCEPAAFQRVRSRQDGTSISVLATVCEDTPAYVTSQAFRLQSLRDPILPLGFRYALLRSEDGDPQLDGESFRLGDIIYHSEDTRALSQNFFDSIQDSALLRALLTAKVGGALDITYEGQPHGAYVEPVPGAPWSLVLFFDQGPGLSSALEAGFAAVVLFILYAILLSLTVALYFALSATGWQWIWSGRYGDAGGRVQNLIALVTTVLATLGVDWLLRSWGVGSLSLFLLLGVSLAVLRYVAINSQSDRPATTPRNRGEVLLLVLTIVVVLPAALIARHSISDFENRLHRFDLVQVWERIERRVAGELLDLRQLDPEEFKLEGESADNLKVLRPAVPRNDLCLAGPVEFPVADGCAGNPQPSASQDASTGALSQTMTAAVARMLTSRDGFRVVRDGEVEVSPSTQLMALGAFGTSPERYWTADGNCLVGIGKRSDWRICRSGGESTSAAADGSDTIPEAGIALTLLFAIALLFAWAVWVGQRFIMRELLWNALAVSPGDSEPSGGVVVVFNGFWLPRSAFENAPGSVLTPETISHNGFNPAAPVTLIGVTETSLDGLSARQFEDLLERAEHGSETMLVVEAEESAIKAWGEDRARWAQLLRVLDEHRWVDGAREAARRAQMQPHAAYPSECSGPMAFRVQKFLNETPVGATAQDPVALRALSAGALPYYRRVWESCSGEQRLVLHYLAEGRLVKGNLDPAVLDLAELGLIACGDQWARGRPRIRSSAFERFVAREAMDERMTDAERRSSGRWGLVRIPLVVALLCGFVFLALSGRETVELAGAMLGLVAAGVPLLLRLGLLTRPLQAPAAGDGD